MILHHDNAWPHTYLRTGVTILGVFFPHPPYSSDLTPTEYYDFLSLANFLIGKNVRYTDDIKNYMDEFFSEKR